MKDSTNSEYPPNPNNSCDMIRTKELSILPPMTLTQNRYERNLHRMPINVKAIDSRVEYLLPFVSAKVFMNRRPIKAPAENKV